MSTGDPLGMPRPAAGSAERGWLPRTAVLERIEREVEGVDTYHLGFRDPGDAASYRFQPGQFNMLYLPGAGEVPISLSADPGSRGSWAHTIRIAGNVTRTIARLRPGGTLGLRGPFGRGWPLDECVGRDVVLVAGGIGLAPLRPAIYHLLRHRRLFGRLNLLYGARSPGTMLYAGEYDRWSDQGLIIHVTVDRSDAGWIGNVGVVTLLLERLRTFDPRNSVLLCCGPDVMMRYTASTANGRGLPAERVWVSTERNMQCAIGLCGHCQLGPQFVCQDGPVFRYDVMEPFMKVDGL